MCWRKFFPNADRHNVLHSVFAGGKITKHYITYILYLLHILSRFSSIILWKIVKKLHLTFINHIFSEACGWYEDVSLTIHHVCVYVCWLHHLQVNGLLFYFFVEDRWSYLYWAMSFAFWHEKKTWKNLLNFFKLENWCRC